MSIRFNGFTLTVGAPIYDGFHVGWTAGKPCRRVQSGGLGASLDPFWFEIPCDCAPQTGDTIRVRARTFGFFDITTIEWNMCGGRCKGHRTSPGFSLGLELKEVRWVVE